MIDCISRVESNNSSCLKPFVLYNLFQHSLSIVKELLCFVSYGFVIEYLRVCAIGILSTNLPALEEGVPIDEWQEFFQVILFEDSSSKELGLSDGYLVPVYLDFLGACFSK